MASSRHRGNLQSGKHTNWGALRAPRWAEFQGPRLSATERAQRFLRLTPHLPECTSNNVAIAIKAEFCDCGLESARGLLAP